MVGLRCQPTHRFDRGQFTPLATLPHGPANRRSLNQRELLHKPCRHAHGALRRGHGVHQQCPAAAAFQDARRVLSHQTLEENLRANDRTDGAFG